MSTMNSAMTRWNNVAQSASEAYDTNNTAPRVEQ